MFDRIHRRIYKLLFEEYATSYTALGVFRIFYALTFIVLLGIPQYAWLGTVPDFMYAPPPGIARLFNGFPDPLTMRIMNGVVVFSLLAVLVGWQTRYMSYVFALCMIICKAWVYSLGKINHDILVWLVPLCLGWHWGKGISIDALRQKDGNSEQVSWPVAFMAFFIAFAFFTASVPKICAGWLDPSYSMFKGFFHTGMYNMERDGWIAEGVAKVNSGIFWEGMDWMTILFEAGFLVAFFKAGVFRVFTAFAVFFHWIVFVAMDIPFVTTLTIYPLFWLPVIIKDKRLQYQRTLLYSLVALAFIAMVIHVAQIDLSMQAIWPDEERFLLYVFSAYAVLGLLVLFIMIRRARKLRQTRSIP